MVLPMIDLEGRVCRIKAAVKDGPSPGVHQSVGSWAVANWKECQLQHADAGQNLSFPVYTGNFAINLPSGGNGTDYGNSGVGVVLGPGQFNWDISIVKLTHFTERHTLQFRAEFFNALNHPQFNNPGGAVSTPTTFGVITSTSVNPRLIQFALKYAF